MNNKLRDLINKFRENDSKDNYSLIMNKIVEMYNNDECLLLPGHINNSKENNLEPSFIYKKVDERVYLLCYTKDAPPFTDGKDLAYMAISIRNIFNKLVMQNPVDGIILNDNDGQGNVFIAKELIAMLLEQ